VGDAEQTWPPLYGSIASWLDCYILGSYGPGRLQTQILNEWDACCLYGRGFCTYEAPTASAVAALGQGSFGVVLDSNNTQHSISSWALHHVIWPVIRQHESEDRDADLLPDWWEYRHAGQLSEAQALPWLNGTNRASDADGDGKSDLEEFESGTLPDHQDDVFRIASVVAGDAEYAISWNSARRVMYQLVRSVDAQNWEMIRSNIIGSGSLMTLHIQKDSLGNTDKAFFQLRSTRN
jgi:hypothetical protein